MSLDLLRRHVGDGPDDLAGNTCIGYCDGFSRRRTCAGQLLGQAEVQNLHIAIETNHDVLRFEVAMHNAGAMGSAQRLQHLPHGLQAPLQGRCVCQPIA